MTVQELYESLGASYTEAKSRLMSDKLISKFVVKYLADPSYNELMAAWDAQNEAEIFRMAHTLKGVAANLALTKLFEAASELTECYRPGQESMRIGKDIPALVQAVTDRYEETVAAIRAFEAAQ